MLFKNKRGGLFMWEEIKKCIGNHYVFRLDGVVISGFFCGIGETKGNCGMIFLVPNSSQKEQVSYVYCLFVHPLKIKCTLHSKRGILNLRKECRKYFSKYHMKNNLDNIYFPIFKIKEIRKKDIKCQ